MARRVNKPKRGAGNRLRIVGGQWRGRQLSFVDAEGLRPTGDRLRETLFNWLQWAVPGGRCLDLFAGSGALGLEAASRAAKEVVCVEQNPLVATQLADNLALLRAERVRLWRGSALDYLAGDDGHFDVVFIDPPFAQDLWAEVVTLLAQGWLAPQAHIYVESPAQQTLSVPEAWQLKREKRLGQVHARLFYAD